MKKELTCIVCPNGCELQIDVAQGADGGLAVQKVTGAACPRGEDYARQEIVDPRRNIATSVAVTGGVLPLVSVRLTKPIPKDRIFDAMAEIKKHVLHAPVDMGAVLIHNVLGCDSDVITTKDVSKK